MPKAPRTEGCMSMMLLLMLLVVVALVGVAGAMLAVFLLNRNRDR